MNKERWFTLFAMLMLSYIGLAIFQINAYIIVFLLICYFAFDFYQGKEKLEYRSKLEKEEVLNEMKSTESDAYLKQKQLLTMISNIPIPLLLLDKEGNVALYNTSFNQFRQSEEEKKLSYLYNDCVSEVAEFLKDAFIFEKQLTKVVHLNNKTFEGICVPVTTKGKFSGSVLLFQDISDAKERESMQKQFIADASHELKTPISVIMGMVEILNREDFNDDKTQKEFLQQIEKETKRLEIIVRDLLQLSRMSSESFILRRELTDFTKVIDSSMASFNLLAKEKGLELTCEYETHEEIYVDRDLTLTLMNNLISNAIKYSDHGQIHVATRKANGEYEVSVRDEGCGLSEEDQVKIFERFYRVDKARSRTSGGSGLGLTIVKSIAEAHRGRVSVESEVDKGSTFKVYFKY